MPAVSKAQQRFMGMVHAAQKGEEPASPEVAKVADTMKKKSAKDFASTKHKGLPDHVDEAKIQKLREYIRKTIREMNVTGNADGYQTPYAFGKPENEKKKGQRQADLTGYDVVNENRWLQLKKEEGPATTKIGKGISNINKQLAEMEKFLNWYGKLKQESGISNENYWKRTNGNIMKIKERLLRLEAQIRKISE